MKKIKMVIGANFGDEGKGKMVSYFCSQSKNPIVVRPNGGAQAGHTVCYGNKRHVFHHFGSGTLQGVPTYCDKEFIVNPIIFRKEYEELSAIGVEPKIYVHFACKVTLPADMMKNQFDETSRGKNRHGSCGLGIFATINRKKPITIDFIDSHIDTQDFLEMIMDADEEFNPSDYMDLSVSYKDIILKYIEDLYFMMDHITICSGDDIWNAFDDIIFECSQGLLLSCDNIIYFPHLTPSCTGSRNLYLSSLIGNLYSMISGNELEICYVSRAYNTRHGAGPLPYECDKRDIRLDLPSDKTNVYNEFQGKFRYAGIDTENLCCRIKHDIYTPGLMNKISVSICITHLDETSNMFIGPYLNEIPVNIIDDEFDIVYHSFGEQTNDIKIHKNHKKGDEV